MPISPIVLQRRHAELGRIRLGAKNAEKGFPMKLSAFRFTSPSKRYIDDLAALYGGTPKPWDNNGKPEHEVYTEAQSIPVIAVKGGLSQWLETWLGGGIAHRCDGEQQVDGTPCDPDEFVTDSKGRKIYVHRDAKPTTRLSVMLPELEAVGVFRMESHGWNAAAEIPAVAELATYVGDLVPAHLHLVERRSVKDGQTSRFVVPVLDLQIGTARLKEIVAEKSGQAAVASAPERAAIEAGAADPYADLASMVEAATTLEELAGVWDRGKADGLLGEASQASPQRDGFVAAFKARAHTIKDADAPAPVAEPAADPDGVWQQVLAYAGSLPEPMSLDQVTHDYEQRYAMSPGEASAAELQTYLSVLQGEGAAA